MATVETNIGAAFAAMLPTLSAESLKIAQAGAAGASRRAAVDTGRLQRSLRAFPTGRARARWGTNVFYSPFLEFGTWKMSARPFVRPSVDDARAAV